MAPVLSIGIAGGSCAGKTMLAARLAGHIGEDRCVLLGLDEFYKQQSDEDLASGAANFDHPEAFDFESFVRAVEVLREGLDVTIPRYDRSISRVAGTTTIAARQLLIVEGLFVLLDPRVVEMLDLRVFIDVDPTVQLGRRLRRDVDQYGRSEDGARRRFAQQVTPAFVEFIAPTRASAHLVLSGGADPGAGIDACLDHLERNRPADAPLFRRAG